MKGPRTINIAFSFAQTSKRKCGRVTDHVVKQEDCLFSEYRHVTKVMNMSSKQYEDNLSSNELV